MNKIKAVIGSMLAALILVAGWSGTATAAKTPPGVARSVSAVKVLCATQGRENAAYWRLCMTPGTIEDAAREYYAVPVGAKGREQRDGWDRRSVCKFADEYGGIHAAARELWFDMAYDNYHRHDYVLTWIGRFAANDCKAMGYRV